VHAKWGHHAFLANQITIFVRIYGTNLKRRVLGLAVIERARKKQASWVMNLKWETQIQNSSTVGSTTIEERTISNG